MVDDTNVTTDSAPTGAMHLLPTMQRNALRKIFDRPEFTPAEVAALGWRRLQQAEGIGQKGLQAIGVWLMGYGYELKPPETIVGDRRLPGKTRRTIDQAVRLLRTHGYSIRQAGEDSAG